MNTILKKLTETLEARKKDDPSKSYTASLYRDGLEAILKKVNEEAFETIIAARQ
ncbi:MAG: phosphoribosyl-ATP diphosphatase, partial [Methylophilaceae bacterium]|nr:phosphoribosyl-ATP diphosphatase [Methylophilaceae bacterium]